MQLAWLTAQLQDKEQRSLFLGSYLLALLSYSCLFVGTVYNNHDFPNSFYSGYPSFTTTAEGRFVGDLLYQLQGGAAIPALHMAIAVAVQVVNGFLAAACLGLTRYNARLCMIALIVIHPAITDYYSWGGVALNFCLGDTFAILAVLYCLRPGSWNLLRSALCVVVSVAIYQPKVSLLATMSCLVLCEQVVRSAQLDRAGKEAFAFCRRLLFVVPVSLAVYFVIFHFTVSASAATQNHRLHFNSFAEVIAQVRRIAVFTAQYFASGTNFLHPNGFRLPGVAAVGMAWTALVRIGTGKAQTRSKFAHAVAFVLLLACLPLCMNAVFLITTEAYATDGRFFGTYAYVLAACLALLLEWTSGGRWSAIWTTIFVALTAFFVVDNAQYSYRGYLQNRFEYSFVTRIAARLENVLEPGRTYRLVCHGDLPWKPIRSRLSWKGNIDQRHVIANYDQPGFINYRRVEYLNFLLGRNVFQQPTAEDQAKADHYARTARPWPAPEAIGVLGDLVVVLL